MDVNPACLSELDCLTAASFKIDGDVDFVKK